MTNLQRPLKVSPLIKLSRWSLLFCGIVYGINRKAFLTAYDRDLKIIRMKEHHEEELEKIRKSKQMDTQSVKELGAIFDIKFPRNWTVDDL